MYVVELEGKISKSVLPLKSRLLERMQLQTDYKLPSAGLSHPNQMPKAIQAPPIQPTADLTHTHTQQYQLQLQKQRFQSATQSTFVPYQPQYNGITKDTIGIGSYPAIIQLADVENSAKILINEVPTSLSPLSFLPHPSPPTSHCTVHVFEQSNASTSDYTSESASSDKDSYVDNPQGKSDKDFCQQTISPPSQSYQRTAAYSDPHHPAAAATAAISTSVSKAGIPGINSATTTTAAPYTGTSKTLAPMNYSAPPAIIKTEKLPDGEVAAPQPSAAPTRNHPFPLTAAGKSVTTDVVRQINKASELVRSSSDPNKSCSVSIGHSNSNSNVISKSAPPPHSNTATGNKNGNGVVPPVQVSAVTKCSPLTAKLYGCYANLFAATAAPATATSVAASSAVKEPPAQLQAKKIVVKQPPLPVANKPVTAPESMPPTQPNSQPNKQPTNIKYSSNNSMSISSGKSNVTVSKSAVVAPPDQEEDTYNNLFRLWASAAEEPVDKLQVDRLVRPKGAIIVGPAAGRSRSDSVELFFSDDEEYSTFDSLEYDKISEAVMHSNSAPSLTKGSGVFGIAETAVAQTTTFVNVATGTATAYSGSTHDNHEITHEDVINGLQKPGYLPKQPSFNQNVFDDGCGDSLEVNCFGEAMLISDPILDTSIHVNPHSALHREDFTALNPSSSVNMSMIPTGSANPTSPTNNKRRLEDISTAAVSMYSNNVPNRLNVVATNGNRKRTTSLASSDSGSRGNTDPTGITTTFGVGSSGVGNSSAYRGGGAESTSSTISSTTSTNSISLDPLRKQQVCIKDEIMSLLQPVKERIAVPASSLALKGDLKAHVQAASTSNNTFKRSPTSSEETEVQYYKSSVDIDLTTAMSMGFENGKSIPMETCLEESPRI